MLKLSAERLPLTVRQRQTARLLLLTALTLVILVFVSSPSLRFWTADPQSELQYGIARRRSNTRITLCTQVLNEVRSVQGPC